MSEGGEESTASARETPILTYRRRWRYAGSKRSVDDSRLDEPAKVSGCGKDEEGGSPLSSPLRYASCPKKQAMMLSEDNLDTNSFLKCPPIPQTWKGLLGSKRVLPPRRVCGQYFLDLGQKDFSRSTCPVCGLMYAKGEEKDEKLHITFHKSQTQGIQFKGWKRERVISVIDDKGSRVICVLPDDPPQHQYKVREVAAVMETELGLLPGWLLEKPCKVYLFISSAKKITGCIVAEPIQDAFVVVPDNSECNGDKNLAESQFPVRELSQHSGREMKPCLKTEAKRLEVHRSPAHLTCDTEDSATILSRGSRRRIITRRASESQKKLPVDTGDTRGLRSTKLTDFFLKAARGDAGQHQMQKPSQSAISQGATGRPSEWKVDGRRIQEPTITLDEGDAVQFSKCSSSFESQNKLVNGLVSADEPIVTPATVESSGPEAVCQRHSTRKEVLFFGNVKLNREPMKRSALKTLCSEPGRAIMCSTVPVRAVCGVRGMWVSLSERRKGIASKLLDTMRGTFSMGFVLQPHHFAFSQPTPDGRAFAARYCDTDKFLVYG